CSSQRRSPSSRARPSPRNGPDGPGSRPFNRVRWFGFTGSTGRPHWCPGPDSLSTSTQLGPAVSSRRWRRGSTPKPTACNGSSRLAAIAPVAGNMADGNGDVRDTACQPERAVSVLSIHGSADAQVPVAGGGRFAPLADVLGRWRELDGCEPSASVAVAGPVTTRTWHCRSTTEV